MGGDVSGPLDVRTVIGGQPQYFGEPALLAREWWGTSAVYALSLTNNNLEPADGSGIAVRAASGSGPGVFASSVSGPAIQATSFSNSGVSAFSEKGIGVYAASWYSTALIAGSVNGNGIIGSGQSTGTGVMGTSVSGIGVIGVGYKAYAGVFYGNVWVGGNFYVGGVKSAAVRHPDGSYRGLYSLESPESWFEDFGEGALKGGKGRVNLDRDFAALVRTNHYHVFVTPKGDCSALYVSRQNRAGFEVREHNGGKSNLRFSYRVVARRKDISGRRLEKIKLVPPTKPEIPKLPEILRPQKPPKVPALPKVSRLPK